MLCKTYHRKAKGLQRSRKTIRKGKLKNFRDMIAGREKEDEQEETKTDKQASK